MRKSLRQLETLFFVYAQMRKLQTVCATYRGEVNDLFFVR